MIRGAIGHLDVAQIVLYAFFAFFIGLVWYLRREDRREGYPLFSEADNRIKQRGFLLLPSPKTFRLNSGAVLYRPDYAPDARPVNAAKLEPWPGAPLQPTGDPMLAGVGPGSYSQRPEQPYTSLHGEDLMFPLRNSGVFAIPPGHGNPIGLTVVGSDKVPVGVISDVWADRSESIVRYYEIELAGAGRRVLLPVYFGRIDFKRRRVLVNSLIAEQFANVPGLANPDRITMQEEDRVAAYYGGGTLYSTPKRSEPLL